MLPGPLYNFLASERLNLEQYVNKNLKFYIKVKSLQEEAEKYCYVMFGNIWQNLENSNSGSWLLQANQTLCTLFCFLCIGKKIVPSLFIIARNFALGGITSSKILTLFLTSDNFFFVSEYLRFNHPSSKTGKNNSFTHFPAWESMCSWDVLFDDFHS